VTHAAQNLCAVLLNLHAATAPVTPLPALQLAIDLRDLNRQTGRQSFNYRD
jgi:hypothetical protein